MSIPTIESVRELDGRIFAMLSRDELQILGFYRDQGRKFDVVVTIENLADEGEMTDEILRRTSSRVSVHVGAEAAGAWAARAVGN